MAFYNAPYHKLYSPRGRRVGHGGSIAGDKSLIESYPELTALPFSAGLAFQFDAKVNIER